MNYLIRVLFFFVVIPFQLALAETQFDVLGGCLLLHEQGKSTPKTLADYCSTISQPKFTNGTSFANMYKWAAPPLAFAFDEAQRGLTGSVTGVTGQAEVVLAVIPEGMVNAITLLRVEKNESHYIFFISSGLIDFVEATVSAQSLDYLNGNHDRIPGIGLERWLQNPVRVINTQNDWALKWPGARPPIPNDWKVRYILVPAHSVYTFIFAHELSHLLMNRPSGGMTPSEVLKTETDVDSYAFDHIAVTSPNLSAMQLKGELLPAYIVSFFAAVAHYEHVKGKVLVSRISDAPPRSTSIVDLLPARDWVSRGRALVDKWETACHGFPTIAMCRAGVTKAQYEARKILRLGAR